MLPKHGFEGSDNLAQAGARGHGCQDRGHEIAVLARVPLEGLEVVRGDGAVARRAKLAPGTSIEVVVPTRSPLLSVATTASSPLPPKYDAASSTGSIDNARAGSCPATVNPTSSRPKIRKAPATLRREPSASVSVRIGL